MRRISVLGALLLACGGTLEIGTEEGDPLYELAEVKAARPDGRKLGTFTTDTARTQRTNHFSYHGGPLMLGTPRVYYVWYGLWNGSPVQPILTELAQNLGGSPYFNVVTAYSDSSGASPSGAVELAGAVEDVYSMGLSLSDTDVALVIGQSILSGGLPADPDGVYFFLPSSDVTVSSGLCQSYCGSHATTSVNGVTVKYAVVANAEACPAKCSPQPLGPNGPTGADAMASLVVAELFNTLTDPTLAAYYDRSGQEGADKCAWSYGTTFQTANGARANVTLGTRDYLLQQLFLRTGSGNGPQSGGCALSR